MDFSLSSSLVGSAVSNSDKLALDLQFAADKTLTARKGPTPAFTRGSSGTFVGSNGLIQSAGNNIARFDHDPVTLACKGLLIEESRTNACFNSNLLTSASWIPTNVTVATDAAGPDGAIAFEVAEFPNNSNHNIGNSGGATSTLTTSVVSGTNYTGSMFFKKVVGSIDWVQLSLGSSGFGTAQYANFNIGNGTIGNSTGLASGTSPQIQDYGNGWYRCSITVTASGSSTTSANIVVFLTNNTDVVVRGPLYAGNTANKIITAMGQFETGTFATSYIPTVAASVIRSADVCSISGSDFSGLYNPLEGSLFTSAIFNAPVGYISAQTLVDINDTSASNRLRHVRNLTTSFPRLLNTSNSILNVDVTESPALSSLTTQKLSTGFKLDDYVLCANNTIVGTDNLGALPISPTTLTIGSSSAGAPAPLTLNGTISALRYYKKRLPNAKIQAITV